VIKKIVLIVAALFWVRVCSLHADTIYLKNGRTMEGLILEETLENYYVDVGFGIIGIKRSDVKSVLRSDAYKSLQLRNKWEREQALSEERAKEDRLKEELAPKHVTVAEDRGQIVVQALLNNKVNVNLILDTGASLVVIRDSVAKQLGIDPSGLKKELKLKLADGRESTVKHVVLTSVNVQGVEALNVDAAILPPDAQDPHLKDGLLGMAYLKNFIMRIDQKNKKVTLEKF
jgi:clan AA aspartic protease (TIGR02281 family)